MIDRELEDAAKELRGVVNEITPPPYKRARPQPRMLQAVASVVLAISAGASLFFLARPSAEVTASSEGDQTVDDAKPFDGDGSDEPIGITGSEPIIVSELEAPTRGSPVEENEFGTWIEAVTSSEGSEPVQIPLQIRPAWNSDGAYFIVYETGTTKSGHVLYNGQTNERIQTLDISPADIEQVYWHPRNPELLYYVNGASLIEYRVDSGAGTTVHDFDGCEVVDGADSLRISHETLELGQLCTDVNGDQELVSVNVETGEERRWEDYGFGAPQPTPSSGRYVAHNDDGLVRVFDQSGGQTGVEFTFGNDRYVVLETSDGRDLFVTVVYSRPEEAIGSIVAFDLATGLPTVVIGEATGYPYPPPDQEFGTSVSNDGRIVFSTFPDNEDEEPGVLEGELVIIDFDDPTPVARRLAHHRSVAGRGGSPQPWNGVYPSLHPTDSRVLFGSDWGGSTANSYIVGGKG